MVKFRLDTNNCSYYDFKEDRSIKAVRFSYLVPLPFFSLKFRSKIKLVNDRQLEELRKKYYRHNKVCGWFSIPVGPFQLKKIRYQNKTHYDQSLAIRKQITPTDFMMQETSLSSLHTLYSDPGEVVCKRIRTEFDLFLSEESLPEQSIILGMVFASFPIEIHLGVNTSIMSHREGLESFFASKFSSHLMVKLVNIDRNDEMSKKLEDEGVRY